MTANVFVAWSGAERCLDVIVRGYERHLLRLATHDGAVLQTLSSAIIRQYRVAESIWRLAGRGL